MAWTNTSNTCVAVFGTLGRLNQIDQHLAFDDAGQLTMKDLEFYNALATAGVNNANVAALALLIDQMMVNGFAGTYKVGFTAQKRQLL